MGCVYTDKGESLTGKAKETRDLANELIRIKDKWFADPVIDGVTHGDKKHFKDFSSHT